MVYTLQCSDSFEWRISDGDSSNRWTLWLRHGGGKWQRVASYSAPSAAALAVASGDTGLVEWDDAIRDSTDFDLSRWTLSDGIPSWP